MLVFIRVENLSGLCLTNFFEQGIIIRTSFLELLNMQSSVEGTQSFGLDSLVEVAFSLAGDVGEDSGAFEGRDSGLGG